MLLNECIRSLGENLHAYKSTTYPSTFTISTVYLVNKVRGLQT